MAIAGLYDKMVMDANTNAADVEAKRTRMKHMGEYEGVPVIVLFRTLPGDEKNCLVCAPKFLPDTHNEALMKAVESDGAQSENELGTYIGRQRFPDGTNMLEMLHNENYLKKQSTTAVTMTYGPHKDGRIQLDKLNTLIAKDKGVKVSDLSIKDTSKEETETKDAKKKSTKK